jgi:hypothetical protein
MDASDLITVLQSPCEEGTVHIWKISACLDVLLDLMFSSKWQKQE